MRIRVSGPAFESQELEVVSWRRINTKTIWIVFVPNDFEQMWESPKSIYVEEL